MLIPEDLEPEVIDPIVDDLRHYLRDSKGLNTLLCDKVESTDEDLQRAIFMGLLWFNSMAPMTAHRIESFPYSAYHFLINEAVIEVLFSAGILHSRNNLAYSDGGVSVNDHDKAGAYQGWMQIIQSLKQLRASEKQYKVQKNIEACFGGMHSEFYDVYRGDSCYKIID